MGSIGTNKQFENEIAKAIEKYPKLSIAVVNGIAVLKGEIDLVDEDGKLRDTYSMEIHPVLEYPRRFPFVFETGGRLPWNADWHVYESDGHCCIKVEPEEILICKRGITLQSFIEQQVVPYFFNQTYRRINGHFINERKHGLMGVIEYYQDILKEKNVPTLLTLMAFIIQNEEPSRVAMCFCGAKNKYRKCHKESYRMIHEIGLQEVQHHVNLITELLQKITAVKYQQVT